MMLNMFRTLLDRVTGRATRRLESRLRHLVKAANPHLYVYQCWHWADTAAVEILRYPPSKTMPNDVLISFTGDGFHSMHNALQKALDYVEGTWAPVIPEVAAAMHDHDS